MRLYVWVHPDEEALKAMFLRRNWSKECRRNISSFARQKLMELSRRQAVPSVAQSDSESSRARKVQIDPLRPELSDRGRHCGFDCANAVLRVSS
jgi:hypothetical protein